MSGHFSEQRPGLVRPFLRVLQVGRRTRSRQGERSMNFLQVKRGKTSRIKTKAGRPEPGPSPSANGIEIFGAAIGGQEGGASRQVVGCRQFSKRSALLVSKKLVKPSRGFFNLTLGKQPWARSAEGVVALVSAAVMKKGSCPVQSASSARRHARAASLPSVYPHKCLLRSEGLASARAGRLRHPV